MSLAVFNSATFITTSGLAVGASATIEVRRETDNGIASIYSDAAGAAPITNPSAFADSSGRFSFYALGLIGGYKITVTKGGESYTLRNVPIGTAGQLDASEIGRFVLAATNAGEALTALLVNSLFGKAITGFTYANNGSDATNDIDIAAGKAMAATEDYVIVCAALTKRLDAVWAVGSNQGGLLSGAIANVDYNIWAIARSGTGTTDIGFETTANATPTLPTNYTHYRKVGWFKRVGATIVAFTTAETEGGGLEFKWTTPTLDVDLAATLTTARRTDAIKVPLDFSVEANINVYLADAGAGSLNVVCCPDQADAAPSTTAAPLHTFQTTTALPGVGNLKVRTSATGTIAARSTLATVDTYRVSTLGFRWARRN